LRLSIIFGIALFAFSFLTSGCALKSTAAKNSGFFNDYEGFKTQDGFSALKSSKEYDASKYKRVLISPVEVIAAVPKEQQSDSQRELYGKISQYVTNGYKREIQKNTNFKLADMKDGDTLVFESAISAVEVHFDDKNWNQFTPIAMDVTVTSYNSYADGNVRMLGEARLLESATGETLFESMEILKDEKIISEGESLEFEDIKPALDKWIELSAEYFKN